MKQFATGVMCCDVIVTVDVIKLARSGVQINIGMALLPAPDLLAGCRGEQQPLALTFNENVLASL